MHRTEAPDNVNRERISDPDWLAYEASNISKLAIKRYQADPYFMVERTQKNGIGKVKIRICAGDIGNPDHYVPIQELTYDHGLLQEMTSSSGFYRYNPKEHRLRFGTYMTDNGNAQWHDMDVSISPQERTMREITRIQVHTDLEALYTPIIHNGESAFTLDRVNLHQYLPLPSQDVAKFLPQGRVITVADALNATINPYFSRPDYQRSCVPEIHKAEGFPALGYADVGAHSTSFVRSIDSSDKELSGFAHPLRNNPDGWLVFAKFKDHGKSIGRALMVEIDRESVQVADRGTKNGPVPTIFVDVRIDGEVFHLAIPERRGSWHKATEENISRTTESHTGQDGTTYNWINVNTEELRTSIALGYYSDDMLNAALTEYSR